MLLGAICLSYNLIDFVVQIYNKINFEKKVNCMAMFLVTKENIWLQFKYACFITQKSVGFLQVHR